MPLKFGPEVSNQRYLRASMPDDRKIVRRRAEGWAKHRCRSNGAGRALLPCAIRHRPDAGVLPAVGRGMAEVRRAGHPMEVGDRFLHDQFPRLLADFYPDDPEPIIWPR